MMIAVVVASSAALATACGATGHRTAGRGAVAQAGCPLPRVRSAPAPALSGYGSRLGAVIGDSLAGCPATARAGRLPDASFPYLGVACGVANRDGCDRVRIGVHLRRPAILVTVQVDKRLVKLSPPLDRGDDLWQGVLRHAGLRRGPLAVRAVGGYWYGEPAVRPYVRVTAYFADGSVATHAGTGYLHAGYG